jgi:hypothetical protein
MRIMAAELAAKATEIEKDDHQQLPPHLVPHHSASSQNNDR